MATIMNKDTHRVPSHQCRSCCWAKEFTTRRKFNLKYENETFLKFSQGSSGYNYEANDSKDEDNENNDENRDICNDEEDSSNDDDYVNDCGLNERNVIRVFLKEEEDSQQYLDLYEEVEGFCRETSLKDLEDGIKDNSEVPVAILHEMDGTQCRPHKGLLAQKQLYESLCRKVHCEPLSYPQYFYRD
jgi:hypothetical protein